jgi:hypothetical protein
VPTYWIAHPTESAFISAFSPEGVGQVLLISRRWPTGRYLIREYRRGASPTADADRAWGYAVKESGGDVLLEPSDEPFGGGQHGG